MSRKLYAILVLIGAIGAITLVYLYFFVYYTATLAINANVSGYHVELFSKSTAQKIEYDCPEQECIISDVSPFEYNISLSKENYKTYSITTKITPRKRETLFVELEKKSELKVLEQITAVETSQQKIQRLRDQKEYFAVFQLNIDSKVTFTQSKDQLIMRYHISQNTKEITRFPLVSQESIQAQYIGEKQEKIFLQLGGVSYIFDIFGGKIYTLPYQMEVNYIKPGKSSSSYLVVTDKGAFLYNTSTEDSEFQYLFKDFIYYKNILIGVIYKDETQKKSNFNLTETGNLIIRYDQQTKERKVLLDTSLDINRIEWRGEQIIFSAKGTDYELKNFD